VRVKQNWMLKINFTGNILYPITHLDHLGCLLGNLAGNLLDYPLDYHLSILLDNGLGYLVGDLVGQPRG